jgi:Zn-finger nucleic acid-binding protein
MRQYERSGVHVDQCSECRGLFLDRGELERLIDAEARWAAQAPTAQAPTAQAPTAQAPTGPSGHDQGYYQQPSHSGHHKKRKSFFEELFD